MCDEWRVPGAGPSLNQARHCTTPPGQAKTRYPLYFSEGYKRAIMLPGKPFFRIRPVGNGLAGRTSFM
jgi:hypothetical protein